MQQAWRNGQIAIVRELRTQLGLGLREAFDLSERYPEMSAADIVAKLKPPPAALPEKRYSSSLTVRGWIVTSKLFPELNGYQPQMTEMMRETLQQDKASVVHEIVYKAEADELIGNMRRLAA